MSKNGFFHERPTDEDIYVAESMVPVVGQKSINWHVQRSWMEGINILAEVEWNGKTYVAELKTFGAEQWWTIIREKGVVMLRQIFANDVPTIKQHIQSYQQGKGPMVVARIAGWQGKPQIYDVREELHPPATPGSEEQALRQLLGMPLLPSSPKRLEVQLDPHGGKPWHFAQTLYLKIEEKEV